MTFLLLISKTLWLNLGAQNRCSQNWLEWTPVHSFSCPCMLCAEFGNTYLLNDVKTKPFIISYDQDMQWQFEKPTFKILISFHRKSRIIKYSLDLRLKNMICKHDVFWTRVAYCIVRVQWFAQWFSCKIGDREKMCLWTEIWYLIFNKVTSW